MALRDRIHSQETEYGVQYVAVRGHRPTTPAVVEAIKREAHRAFGLDGTDFLANGSKLYHDVGHAEWALPECRSAYEAAVYDKAADHLLLHHLLPRVDADFAQKGGQGRVVVIKNNTDAHGNTYGCHENYQMLRDADLLSSSEFLRYCVQCLVPFLVTRQILAGAGHLIAEARPGPSGVRYELSQRATYMEAVVSRDTTRHRAIFNLGREGESFSGRRYRRLHQILGDANLSGWATFIKLGTTGLMLRLVEDLFFDAVPVLADPLRALQAVSRDLRGTAMLPLQDGRSVTALDIQWMYYNLADEYLNLFGASPEDETLMEAWGQALEDFGREPLLLRDRADWAIKRQLLESFLQQHDRTLETLRLVEPELITELRALDLRYHELSPQGLYCQLYPVDTLVRQAEILRAQETPPPFTRARVRGAAIWLGRQVLAGTRIGPWSELLLEEERITLPDPLDFDHRSLVVWDRPGRLFVTEDADAPADHMRLYKLGRACYYAGDFLRALEAFRGAAHLEPISHSYSQAVAATCLALGQFEEAIRWFAKQHAQAAESGDGAQIDHVGLGNVWRLTGDFEQAIAEYRKATRSDSYQAALAYANLAAIHLKNGESRSAETCYRQALQREDRLLGALVGLGAILLLGDDSGPGSVLLQRALDLPVRRLERDMLPASAAIVRAVARLAQGDSEALGALESALNSRGSDTADGLFLLEPLLELLGRRVPRIPQIDAARAMLHTGVPAPAPEAPLSAPAPASLEWIEAGMQHPSAEVRQRAVAYAGWRLAELPLAESVPYVALMLEVARKDADPGVRRAALRALGQPMLRDTPAMNEVIALLHDPDPGVRWSAQLALEQITLPGMPVSMLRSNPAHDTTAADTLAGQVRLLRELHARQQQVQDAQPEDEEPEFDEDEIPF